jgi:exopolysaccharide biosynthesis polyprenyl glycosylphosphotransferase
VVNAAPTQAMPTSTTVGTHELPILHRAPGVGSGVEVPRLVVAPRERGRLHYLLEGPGWWTLNLASDLLTSLLAVTLAVVLTPSVQTTSGPWSLFAFPLVVGAMPYLRSAYRHHVSVDLRDALGPVVAGVSMAAMAMLAWLAFVTGATDAGTLVARTWAAAVVLVCLGRLALALAQRTARSRGVVVKPTLIVGAGLIGERIARRLLDRPKFGLRPVGFLDADPLRTPEDDPRVPVLGHPDEVAQLARQTGAEHVILAFSSAPDEDLLPLTRECEALGLEVSLVPRLFESINDRVALDRLGGLPLLGLRSIDPKGVAFRLKYALDRPLALLLLIAAAPILGAAAVAVKLTSPGPVLFRQRRVGRDGQVFHLLKLRSMRVAEEPAFEPADGLAPGGVEGPDRRTRVGCLLRRLAIDELPQLYNVIRGEMSLVGPRPERPEFTRRFQLDHRRYEDRHRVKSGITGWAQVNGLRGQTSLGDRVEWDNFYIENWSLWLDVKVLLLTAGAVLRSGDDA